MFSLSHACDIMIISFLAMFVISQGVHPFTSFPVTVSIVSKLHGLHRDVSVQDVRRCLFKELWVNGTSTH